MFFYTYFLFLLACKCFVLFCGCEIFKPILITSFTLLLVIVIDTHFAPLKDLSKAFACMANDNLKCTSLILASLL